MPNEFNTILLATKADSVAAAVSAAFGAASGKQADLRRVEPDNFAPDQLGLGGKDVLLIGDSGLEAASNFEYRQANPGLIQFLGCRPPPALVSHLIETGSAVAGISTVIAPRVANRVLGFSGPLTSTKNAQYGDSGPAWGIVGLGVIGIEVARKILPAGASVGVADIRTPRAGILLKLNIRRQSLDLLVAGSDVITLHVRPGPTASPLISERELRLMKHGAVLINTADSSVVDETAVLEALANGPLGGYATDCPGEVIGNADAALASSGNLIITTNPLINQIGAAQQVAKFVVANVGAFNDGTIIEGQIEPIDFPIIGDPSFWSSRMSPREK